MSAEQGTHMPGVACKVCHHNQDEHVYTCVCVCHIQPAQTKHDHLLARIAPALTTDERLSVRDLIEEHATLHADNARLREALENACIYIQQWARDAIDPDDDADDVQESRDVLASQLEGLRAALAQNRDGGA